MSLVAVAVMVAPPAMAVAVVPAGLADEGQMRRGGNRCPRTGNGGLAGGGREAENDGAADQREWDVTFHSANSRAFRARTRAEEKNI